MEKIKMIEYTIQDFNTDIAFLCDEIKAIENINIKYIYAIPQGGVPAGIALSRCLGAILIPYEEITIHEKHEVLIVDDLIDSGKTIKQFGQYPIAVLGRKRYLALPSQYSISYARIFPNEWIHFWWEPTGSTDSETLVTRMLENIGEDPTRPGLEETPKRVVKMWKEVFGGMNKDNRPRIQVVPNGEDGVFYDEMLRDSGYFFSHCEHHLVPFFGKYYFGYIPDKQILGASKIGRLVDYYSARPQIAERLVNQVINDIEEAVKPLGSILVMNARHLCKEMRGLKKWNSPYEAIATRGVFRKNLNDCKAEFLARLPVES